MATKLKDGVEGVSVQEDGVKIGWRVFALLAAVGVGLYVTSVINPIEKRVEDNARTIAGLSERISNTERELNQAQRSIDVMKNELEHLRLEQRNGK